MKLITELEVRNNTHLSPSALRRAQKEQDFPLPVRLTSDDPRGKKLYVEEEVIAWLEQRIAESKRIEMAAEVERRVAAMKRSEAASEAEAA